MGEGAWPAKGAVLPLEGPMSSEMSSPSATHSAPEQSTPALASLAADSAERAGRCSPGVLSSPFLGTFLEEVMGFPLVLWKTLLRNQL